VTLDPQQLAHLSVTIVGAAREGIALARFLTHYGAEVTLTDTKTADQLGDQVSELAAMDVSLVLGSNPDSLLDVDVLFQSPGVPPYAEIIQQARRRGVPVSSEPRLFTQLCAAPIVGITGSSGKTTTTALTGAIFSASGAVTWVGGNIGTPLTDRLVHKERPDVAVIELSSFQLQLFAPEYQGETAAAKRSAASRIVSLDGWSPPIAAVTNVTPNHLDRHPSMEDYVRAKANIMRFQSHSDVAVLNWDDKVARQMSSLTKGHLRWFSLREPIAEGAFVDGDALVIRDADTERVLCRREELLLRGEHNVANTLAAACLAAAGGVDIDVVRHVARTFRGVPHRLEDVRTWRGITFVNDSIATSPKRAIAALRSYEEPIVLLAGGRDKHLPWDRWASLALERTRVIVSFGEARPIICDALGQARGDSANEPRLVEADDLEHAVIIAAGLAKEGDVVLLSPGGTSFDAFRDYEARGERFRQLVAGL